MRQDTFDLSTHEGHNVGRMLHVSIREAVPQISSALDVGSRREHTLEQAKTNVRIEGTPFTNPVPLAQFMPFTLAFIKEAISEIRAARGGCISQRTFCQFLRDIAFYAKPDLCLLKKRTKSREYVDDRVSPENDIPGPIRRIGHIPALPIHHEYLSFTCDFRANLVKPSSISN